MATSSRPPTDPSSPPLWLLVMRKWQGTRESLDGALNPVVRDFFNYTNFPKLKVTIKTSWCAAAASAALEKSGAKSPHSAAAIDFEEFGDACDPFRPGALLVFGRHDPANPRARHVGFSEGPGKTPGHVRLLAGNQHNMVCELERDISELTASRWPPQG